MITGFGRFWSKVNIGAADACWPWLASTKNGYGQINVGGEISYAHRLSYEFANGEIPSGLFVCHRCDNKSCVNPVHLFLGTQQDNMDDMIAKGRDSHAFWAKQTHCVNGHPFSGENLRVQANGKWRVCRACKREWAKAAYHAKRVQPTEATA